MYFMQQESYRWEKIKLLTGVTGLTLLVCPHDNRDITELPVAISYAVCFIPPP